MGWKVVGWVEFTSIRRFGGFLVKEIERISKRKSTIYYKDFYSLFQSNFTFHEFQ